MRVGRLLIAGIGLLTLIGCSRQHSKQDIAVWDAEIARLRAEQDSLRQRAADLVKDDPNIQRLPEGDVVISVPTSFVRNVLERVFEDVVSNVTLRVGGIKAHVAKTVKKVVKIGEFTVDVDVHEVVGKIRTHKPDIRFADNQIAMNLPIEISEGTGNASIHFVWDGKNVAGVACGDMDVTQQVSGTVIPARYEVRGTLGLEMRGNEVVSTPRFPETKLRIQVEPSKKTWQAIDSLLAEKGGACGYVLDKVNVPNILRGVVVEKGFNIGLPLAKLKPFIIPAGVRDSVRVKNVIVAIEAKTNSIRIDPDAILYSASVELK